MKTKGFSSPKRIIDGKICHLKRSPHTRGKRKPKDQRWIYNWFHNNCDKVTPDKSRPQVLKGKRVSILLNGNRHKVKCVRHVMEGHKLELVKSFLSSAEYKQWQSDNDGESLTPHFVQTCICPCMSKAKVNECACKICTEFTSALTALKQMREQVRRYKKCRCAGCSNPASFEKYNQTIQDPQKFRANVCCPKQSYPHLVLPHTPGVIPSFYPLKCCKETPESPPHINQCTECGVHKALYRHEDCLDRTDDEATWMQWVPTEVDASEKKGGKTIREVYRKQTGTRKELVDRVFELAQKYLFHIWVHRMTTHLGKLHVATFDGITTIMVKADFAATVILKAEYMATCEFGRSTNMYVALVLSDPEEEEEKEKEKDEKETEKEKDEEKGKDKDEEKDKDREKDKDKEEDKEKDNDVDKKKDKDWDRPLKPKVGE